MAVIEASPVFFDTRADLRMAELEPLEPSIEELEAIEAEIVEEVTVDPLELMASYVKSLRGERFATRDVARFEPELTAQQRTQFMHKFVKLLQRDEETGPLLRADGNTKGRSYWLASVFSPGAAAEGPEWFETHANIELDDIVISNSYELDDVRRLLQRLHTLREEGIEEINGQSIRRIFALCNSAISTFHANVSIIKTSQRSLSVNIRSGGSLPPIGDESVDKYDYTDYANCRGVDPDLFFPERGASVREAKEVCRGCVVREDCLEFALTNGEKHGIWGGMSERERRRMRRQRKTDTITASKNVPVALAD